MFVGEVKYMRNFKQILIQLLITIKLPLGVSIVKICIKSLQTGIERYFETIFTIVYLCYVATKAKNRKLRSLIIILATLISILEFNLVPSQIVEIYN
jgi:hypothetical protein